MKINFAQVPAQDVDTFGDENLFGPDQAGNFYYNYVEYGTNPGGTDEVAIVDGCDRFMPIAVDNIPDLIAALADCYQIAQGIKAAEKVQDYVNSNAQSYVADTNIQTQSFQDSTCWPWN